MEGGGVCESHGASEKRGSRLQRRIDDEHHQVKRKRKRVASFSWFPRSKGGSERRRKPKKDHVSWEPSITDAIKGGFQHLLSKDQQSACRELTETDAAPRQIGVRGGAIKMHQINVEGNLRNAKRALEFYEASQGVKFEVLKVLFSRGSRLRHPRAEECQYWVHTSFVAKPRNGDCSDLSPKHFFGELLKGDRSGDFSATYCSTFEPSDEPGFDHGCIFCGPDQKFHPASGYSVGRPPWYIPRRVFGFPM